MCVCFLLTESQEVSFKRSTSNERSFRAPTFEVAAYWRSAIDGLLGYTAAGGWVAFWFGA